MGLATVIIKGGQIPPPTCPSRFHLGPLHTILDKRLAISKSCYQNEFLMVKKQTQIDSIVADYWDNHTDESYFGETYWLANPIINHRYQLKAAGGRFMPIGDSWVDFTVECYLTNGGSLTKVDEKGLNQVTDIREIAKLVNEVIANNPGGVKQFRESKMLNRILDERTPVDKVLSIGSGDGALERHLASINAAKEIVGIDLAPKRIEIAKETANRLAKEYNVQNPITYIVGNVETSPLPGSDYDAIYFNSSLHHMSDLDSILQSCSNALKHDGYLFINEYIGPNRFDFSKREREVMTSVFQTIPIKYRISQADYDKGKIRTHLAFPSPEEVERVDPSEAINSAGIVEAVCRHFDIVEFNSAGGTLIQFMLDGIAGNFRHDDEDSLKVLDLIFKIEDTLVESGDLSPHFAMIVAQPCHV